MIRVALVEDEESSQRTLTEYLERFSQEINEKIHVSIFPDGAEIVEDYRGNYDIICMAVHSARAGNSASALDFLP